MMKSKQAKRVVIALRLSTQAGQRTLQGIYRYLTENRIHWDVRIKRDSDEFGLANVARYPKWGIDGIIFGMCAPDDRLDTSIAEIAGQKAPIVAVDVRNERPLDERRKNIAFVNTDAVSVGKEAADFFMRHGGYQSFGYVPDFRGRIWGKLRGDAFVAELKSKGFECSCYVHPPLDKDNSEDFRRWLRSLRKPAALFVACDDQALTVVEACRKAKLRIPRDISVLGVDDDVRTALFCQAEAVIADIRGQNASGALRLEDLNEQDPDRADAEHNGILP